MLQNITFEYCPPTPSSQSGLNNWQFDICTFNIWLNPNWTLSGLHLEHILRHILIPQDGLWKVKIVLSWREKVDSSGLEMDHCLLTMMLWVYFPFLGWAPVWFRHLSDQVGEPIARGGLHPGVLHPAPHPDWAGKQTLLQPLVARAALIIRIELTP